MTAPNHSQVLAAKAAIEQARVTKQTEKALSMFADAESVEQVCRYLAGFASVSWTKPPTGEFDSDAANLASLMAVKRLEEIIQERLYEVVNGQVAKLLEQAQAKINAFPDLEADPYAFFQAGHKVRMASDDRNTFGDEVGIVLEKDPEMPNRVHVSWPDDTNGFVRGRNLVIVNGD
ncbi:hypothetical protein SEA_LUCKYLEO_93 [Gordonia phage LuckyLeo]|nr:hypothetical protein SEA_LUCKYLEO_93 [Gordonia phage LuckyLeo]